MILNDLITKTILSPQDTRAVTRVIDSSIGFDFCASIIRVSNDNHRSEIIKWIRGHYNDNSTIYEVDLSKLPGINLWAELHQIIPTKDIKSQNSIIIIWGLESGLLGARKNVSDVFQQLNVQRDLFVRDFPVPWLLLLTPFATNRLKTIAPDFCDFITHWTEPLQDNTGTGSPGNLINQSAFTSGDSLQLLLSALPESRSRDLLIDAHAAIDSWDIQSANDFVDQYKLSSSQSPLLSGIATLTECDIMLAQGRLENARNHALAALRDSEQLTIGPRIGIEAKLRLIPLCVHKGEWSTAWMHIRQCEDLVKQDGAGEVAPDLALVQGNYHFDNCNIKQAQKCWNSALELISDKNRTRLRLEVYRSIARAHGATGDWSAATKLRRDVIIPLCDEIGDKRNAAIEELQIASYLTASGSIHHAKSIINTLLKYFLKIGDKKSATEAYSRLSDVYTQDGEWDLASELILDQIIPFYRSTGNFWGLTNEYISLSHILINQSDPVAAIKLLQDEAFPIAEQLSSDNLKLLVQFNLARAYIQHSEGEKAYDLLNNYVIPGFKRIGALHTLAIAKESLAGLLISKGDLDSAQLLLNEVESQYLKSGDTRSIAISSGLRAQLFWRQNERQKAIDLVRTSIPRIRSVSYPNSIRARFHLGAMLCEINTRQSINNGIKELVKAMNDATAIGLFSISKQIESILHRHGISARDARRLSKKINRPK